MISRRNIRVKVMQCLYSAEADSTMVSEGMALSLLKKYLDENYDVVIIDTPPFGLVTDAQLLDSWADISLVVPSSTTARIQEMHITLGQMLCGGLEIRLGLVSP
jgi:Mrp family chromosome partitioning ATPase